VRAGGRGVALVAQLERELEAAEQVLEQTERRLAGERSPSGASRWSIGTSGPVRRGNPREPTEFGYIEQLAEVTPNTKPGTRGFLLPSASAPGNGGSRSTSASRGWSRPAPCSNRRR